MNNCQKFLYGDQQLFLNYEKVNCIDKGKDFIYQIKSKNGQKTNQCIKEIILQSQQRQQNFKKQIELLKFIHQNPHLNIIDYIGFYVIQKNNVKFGYIQMERAITNLDNFIQSRKNAKNGPQYFIQQQVYSFTCTMVKTHSHLQELGITHRAIKPENILIINQSPILYKICDVGLQKTRTLIGKQSYLAPELYQYLKVSNYKQNYNPCKSDVYSLGLVFLYFCSLTHCKQRGSFQEQFQRNNKLIKQIKQRYKGIKGLSKILKMMLKADPNERPDFISLQNNLVYLNRTFQSWNQKLLTVQKPEQNQYQINHVNKINMIDYWSQHNQKIQHLKINLNNIGRKNLSLQSIDIKSICQSIKKIKNLNLNKLNLELQLSGLQQENIKIICQGIERNKNLIELNLKFWNNSIMDNGMNVILDTVSKLTKLYFLQIQVPSNKITDKSVAKNAHLFQNLNQLQKLILDFGINQLTIDSSYALFNSISKLNNLQQLSLNLQSNKINITSIKQLEKYFEQMHLKKLTLNMSSNKIQNQGFYQLGDLIPKLKQLKTYNLILWNCLLNDKGFKQFARSTSQSKSLEEFSLICWKQQFLISNKLTSKGVQDFVYFFKNIKTLKSITLNLSNNRIQNLGIKFLCQCLIELPLLKKTKLILDSINCSHVGCKYIGRLLEQHPKLKSIYISLRQYLYINSNKILQQGSQLIISGLKNLKQINNIVLILEGCQIGNNILNQFTKILPNLPLQMLYLNLLQCNIYDEGAFALAMCLIKMRMKEAYVDLRKNPITNQCKENIDFQIRKKKVNYNLEIKLP